MKGTRPYWYHNMAYSMEPYFVCLHFPNLIPSTSYIPLAHIVVRIGCAGVRVRCVLVRVRCARVFSYQHIGIPKACIRPMRDPNVNGFAFCGILV